MRSEATNMKNNVPLSRKRNHLNQKLYTFRHVVGCTKNTKRYKYILCISSCIFVLFFSLSPYVHVHSDRNVSKTLLIKISFVFLSIAEIWKHISEPKFRVQDFIHIHTRTPRDTFKRNIQVLREFLIHDRPRDANTYCDD